MQQAKHAGGWLRRAVVAIVIICLTACTSVQVIDHPAPAQLVAALNPGDQVKVVMDSGAIYMLEVTRVTQQQITGRAANGQLWNLNTSKIASIEHQYVDGGKTAGGLGLAALGVVLLALGAVYLFGRALEKDIRDHQDGDGGNNR